MFCCQCGHRSCEVNQELVLKMPPEFPVLQLESVDDVINAVSDDYNNCQLPVLETAILSDTGLLFLRRTRCTSCSNTERRCCF